MASLAKMPNNSTFAPQLSERIVHLWNHWSWSQVSGVEMFFVLMWSRDVALGLCSVVLVSKSSLAVAYLPLGHLGHAPPLNCNKNLAYGKNATLEKWPQLICMFLYYIHYQ